MSLHLLLNSILHALQALPDDEPGKEARIRFIKNLAEEVKILDSLSGFTRLFLVNGSIQIPLADVIITGISGECLLVTVNARAERPQILNDGAPAPAITPEGLRTVANQIRDFLMAGLKSTSQEIVEEDQLRWLRGHYRGWPRDGYHIHTEENIERAMAWNESIAYRHM